jgi:hypothetical protein
MVRGNVDVIVTGANDMTVAATRATTMVLCVGCERRGEESQHQ